MGPVSKMLLGMIPLDFIVLLLTIFALALVAAAVVFLCRRRYVCRLQDLRADHFRMRKRD